MPKHLESLNHFGLLEWPFGTESISPAVFEVLGSIRVLTLTFQGYVTSSSRDRLILHRPFPW